MKERSANRTQVWDLSNTCLIQHRCRRDLQSKSQSTVLSKEKKRYIVTIRVPFCKNAWDSTDTILKKLLGQRQRLTSNIIVMCGVSLMISPLLRQSFLLSSSTVFMFSIHTASTGPSNMYLREKLLSKQLYLCWLHTVECSYNATFRHF